MKTCFTDPYLTLCVLFVMMATKTSDSLPDFGCVAIIAYKWHIFNKTAFYYLKPGLALVDIDYSFTEHCIGRLIGCHSLPKMPQFLQYITTDLIVFIFSKCFSFRSLVLVLKVILIIIIIVFLLLLCTQLLAQQSISIQFIA